MHDFFLEYLLNHVLVVHREDVLSLLLCPNWFSPVKFSVGHSFQIFFKLHFYLLTPHQTHQLSQQHFTPPGVTISREKHHKICHLSGKSVAKEQNFLCFLVATKVPHPSILSLYHSQQKLHQFQKNTVPSTLTNYCRFLL